MDSQSAGEQQGRQQPVYDIRNGGHYGKLPLQASLAHEHRILTQHYRRECSSMLPLVLNFSAALLTINYLAFGARIRASCRIIYRHLGKCWFSKE